MEPKENAQARKIANNSLFINPLNEYGITQYTNVQKKRNGLQQPVAFQMSKMMRALLLGSDCIPYGNSEGAAYHRAKDEYPYILEGFTAGEESRSDRTGGVH